MTTLNMKKVQGRWMGAIGTGIGYGCKEDVVEEFRKR